MKGRVYRRTKPNGELYDKWTAVVDVGRDPKTGKRKQRMKSTFKTEKEAEKWARGELSKVDSGTYRGPSKETVGTFLNSWLGAIRPPASKLRESTWQGYKRLVDAYVIPRVGDAELEKLDAVALDNLYRELLHNGRTKRPGGLSGDSVRHVAVVVHKALKYAVRKGKLTTNPADLAEPIGQQKPHHSVWNDAELRAFLAATRDDRLFPLWHLEAVTGLRRSEILGFPWSAVDLEAKTLSVVQSLVRQDGYRVDIVPMLKRDSSWRSVALDDSTVAVLKSWKAKQAVERLKAGKIWKGEHDLVFTLQDGSWIHPELLSDWFDKAVKAAGVKRITLHEMRHSYATLALRAGAPVKVISQRLGHSSISITYDLYSHVIPGDDHQAAELFAKQVLAPNLS